VTSSPPFTADGMLPPGDYELTLTELRGSTLVIGPGADYPNWDVPWRRRLVDNLEILVEQLRDWDPAQRRPYRGYPKKQLPMWHQYRVELYPHVGQPSGIRDRFGNELEFPSAFRLSRRDGRPRGIVKIGARP
jgi:hypothetical protein